MRSPEEGALETILTRPLTVFGYSYDDPDLPRMMIADVGGSATALPLLSFTARALWDRRDRQARTLRSEDYRAIGGVGGALASHADSVLVGLSPKELELARKFGATDGVDASQVDPIEAVRELTGGGVHYAFEAIGLKVTAP